MPIGPYSLFRIRRPGESISPPGCSRILIRLYAALPMSWAISRPRACMKITLSGLLIVLDGRRDRRVGPTSFEPRALSVNDFSGTVEAMMGTFSVQPARVDLTRPHTYHFMRVTLFCREGIMWRE